MLRGYLLGVPPSDERVAQSILYFPLYVLYLSGEEGSAFNDQMSHPAYSRLTRSLTGQFSYGEIQEIFAGYPASRDATEVYLEILQRVQAKGLAIPSSPAEAEAATQANERLRMQSNDKQMDGSSDSPSSRRSANSI